MIQPKWVAVALAAAPHVFLLAWMTLMITQSSGTDRMYASILGYFELLLLPIALAAAAVTWFIRPLRRFAAPIAAISIAGAVLVFTTAMIVAQERTWS
ncbi:hypothetical protein OHA21_09125 [Actinoplanes sp. NBC_00393]|uniref:hypothetical protein n=1 Tax=Actinoplanes sp. NBC_00393 TaxID=2975953 RepID=UPI002E1B857B